ncbi:Dipeptidyl aminopeptidase BI [Geodia barretti]|uniref:Dipeptidyl aminopeptidase BI n=1 Tax=Geodia barretti TaxID=519541 RepID=A0AA35RK54_GEOBA|nr:Dipeptidyl aminopeptidase BI [Geodia barretti]
MEDEDYPTVDDEDVIAYLEAENDYFDAKMAPYQDLIDTIYAEIEGRQPAELASVPRKGGDWYYQSRYGEGSQYREWLRWPASDPDAREGPTDNVEVFLDEPALAEGLEYFRLGSLSVSNDGSKVAYSTDTNGTERYILVVKDLETGELLPEEIEETRGGAIWSTDDSSFFYTFLDETGHPFQVRRHIMGGPVEDDTVVYEETDAGFFVWTTRQPNRFWWHPGDRATTTRLTTSDRFVIMTNDNHQNYRMAIAPEDDPTEEAWETLLQGTESLYIQYFHVTEDYVAVEERIDGLDQPTPPYIQFDPEYDENTLRLAYTSMTTPWTDFDYHIDTKELESRKVQEIPSGYDSSEFVTNRELAPARDGVMVPVSIVRHKDTPVDGSAPLYIYAYGAYGSAVPRLLS